MANNMINWNTSRFWVTSIIKRCWNCIIFNNDDSILIDSFKNIQNSIPFSIKNNEKCYYKLNSSKVYSGDANNPNILFNLNETKLKGTHNIQNILAAATMAKAYGINQKSIQDTIINFTPIPHRLEWIGKINEVNYFNDSKATNIAATKAAIESFKSKEKRVKSVDGLNPPDAL